MLPALSTLLHEDRIKSESSPFLTTLKSNFHCDDQGIIRLPPLLTTSALNANRPRSVESCVRYTATPVPISTAPSALTSSYSSDTSSKLFSNNPSECSTASSTPVEMVAEIPAAKTKSTAPQYTPSTPMVSKTTKKEMRAAASNAAKARKLDNILTPLSAVKAAISTPTSDDKKRAFAFITHSQETFPTKEPKIDNAPLARRKRRRTSSQELNILQAEFERCSTPDKQTRMALADRCHMTEKAVQVWFQNKRQSVKRHKVVAETRGTSNGSVKPTITPLASRTSSEQEYNTTVNSSVDDSENVPQLSLPLSTSSPKRSNSNPTEFTKDKTPTKNSKRSQALTFHLDSNKKTLTPVKTSPNSRVNRLINVDNENSPSKEKPKLRMKKETGAPLRALNPNVKR
ncbi:Homeobox protein YOX1 [Nakaseomyces bracarensis]|uniref:Homeobox protein YOX1 n=1 Tax=Nakaseomyces bracarensis TaxID=273131 RepID=A0ABR4P0E1_9SACH